MAAAGAGVPPVGDDERARVHVALTAQDLINQPRIFAVLDETNGCKDWKRVKEWIVREASAAGEDFRKALLFEGNLEPAPNYSDALITDNTAHGIWSTGGNPTANQTTSTQEHCFKNFTRQRSILARRKTVQTRRGQTGYTWPC